MRPMITLFNFCLGRRRGAGRCAFGYRRFDFWIGCYWVLVAVRWNAIDPMKSRTQTGIELRWNDRKREVPEGEYIHEHVMKRYVPGEMPEWEFGR